MCLCSGGQVMPADDHIEDNHTHGPMCIFVCKEQLESIGYHGSDFIIASSKATSASEKIPQAQVAHAPLLREPHLIWSSHFLSFC
jgi:hypothetical protein